MRHLQSRGYMGPYAQQSDVVELCTLGASIITYTTLGGPYHKYSLIAPPQKTLHIRTIKAPMPRSPSETQMTLQNRGVGETVGFLFFCLMGLGF